MKAANVTEVTIDGKEYVILPKPAYLRLRGETAGDGSVDALAFAAETMGRGLRTARETAKLTQAELAEKLGKSQTLVSQAEAGAVRVGARYVSAVLAACGLPDDWKASRSKRKARG